MEHDISHIRVQALRLRHSAKAYGLMRLVKPSLSREVWDEYAAGRLLGRSTGRIISAEDRRGYLMGLACFDIRHTLGHERELVVEELVALGLFPAQIRSVTDGLLEECERIRDAERCDGLRLEIARPVSGAWNEAVGWLLRGQHGLLANGGGVVGHA